MRGVASAGAPACVLVKNCKTRAAVGGARKYVTGAAGGGAYNAAAREIRRVRRASATLLTHLRKLSPAVNVQAEVVSVLDRVLNLKGRTTGFGAETPLLGAIPELDSMAVVAVITSLEERFGFAVDDDEIDGSTFATVGALVGFVEGKLKS